MLDVQDLSFSYGPRLVLRGVCLQAQPGELLFVLGANGAGKTTLFRCILGLLPGYGGQIRVDGQSIAGLSARALAQKVAYIPQSHHPAFPYSVMDMVLMGTNHRLAPFASPGRAERQLAMEALETLGIADYASRSFQRLSGGEQQLVLIARALAQQARILLMDEPTSALDFGNQVRVLERAAALANQGYTILISCHNPQHAMLYAQRVVALHDGRIVADGPPADALDEGLMQRLYGVPARFVRTGDGILIAPLRRTISLWTPDMIRFMQDAAAVNGCYPALARAVHEILPGGGRLCDAGCGIGSLSLALAPYFSHVVAADASPEAIQALRRSGPPDQVEPRLCDVLSDVPKQPYDAMVFCFFGTLEEVLRTARRQCSGTVVLIRRTRDTHRFSHSAARRSRRQNLEQLCRALEERGIPFHSREVEVDMGQPFRTLEDAVLFFRTHSRDDDPAALTPEAVQQRLERRDDPVFPWYFPVHERIGLLWLQACDIPDPPTEKGDEVS